MCVCVCVCDLEDYDVACSVCKTLIAQHFSGKVWKERERERETGPSAQNRPQLSSDRVNAANVFCCGQYCEAVFYKPTETTTLT